MFRAAIAAIALLALPSCAHAQTEAQRDAPIVQATAHIVVEALAPSSYGDWRYDWAPVSARVSSFVHWHIFAPDPRGRAADAIVRRNGWVEGEGAQIGVSVFGNDSAVTMLSFEYDEFHNLDLLNALHAEGAEVSFQADYESYSEYVITPPERQPGLLTLRRVCTSEHSAVARRCHNEAELTFSIE